MKRFCDFVFGFLTFVLYPLSIALGVLIGNGTLVEHFWKWGFLWILCMGAWAI